MGGKGSAKPTVEIWRDLYPHFRLPADRKKCLCIITKGRGD